MGDEGAKRGIPGWVKGGVAVVALLAIIWTALYFKRKHTDEEGAGELQVARMGALADGRSVLLVVANVVHKDSEGPDEHVTRLDVIDAAAGARLVRLPRAGVTDCIPTAAGLVWCVDGKKLSVRDLASLAVVVKNEDLEKQVPSLAKGTAQEPQVDPDGNVIVTTNDGNTWSIAIGGCRTRCVATELKEAPKSVKLKTFFSKMGYQGGWSAGPPTRSSITLPDGRTIELKGENKRSLVINADGKTAPLGSTTFLKPELLVSNTPSKDAKAKETFAVGGAELVLVLHSDTLDELAATKSVSAFDLNGQSKWTVQIGRGNFRLVARAGDVLVGAVDAAGGGYAFGVSLTDGRLVWRKPT